MATSENFYTNSCKKITEFLRFDTNMNSRDIKDGIIANDHRYKINKVIIWIREIMIC